jgi:tetratricopeptide (TPR) repeat protein
MTRKTGFAVLETCVGCVIALAVMFVSAAGGQGDDALRINNEGIEYLNKGEFQKAIARLEAARRIDPKSSTIAINLASAYLRQAEELIGRGELKDAVHWLDQAISVGAGDEALKNNLAAAYNDIANIHMRSGRYSDAISLLETAVSIKPGSSVLRCNLGIALYNDNRREEALEEFRGALSSDPDNPLARKMCGLILYWKGQMQEALNELKAAARLSPSDEEVQSVLRKIEREYSVEKEFDVDSQVNFTVSFDGKKDYRVGRAVIDALEEARGKVGSDLNFYPREKLAVVIYSGGQFHSLLDKPKNVGGVYDGKIRVPVGGLDTDRDKDMLRQVLRHEYAHAAVHFLTHNRCPLWLNEGIAEYESEAWDRNKEAQISEALQKGSLIPLKELPGVLKSTSSPRIGLAYCEALSVVRFIADRHGVYNIRRILDNIDAGDDIDKALSKAISRDMAGLEEDWKKSLGR